jgi:hypothetical protein
MQSRHSQPLFIYRMTHIDNVPFIVQNGLWARLSQVQDSNFIPIGNPDIIDKRTRKFVPVSPPGGVLGEYVPFYFSGHSPMLFNIVTGYNVKKVLQKDIVFIVCDAFEIVNAGISYCFTDGNATNIISKFYNSLNLLNELGWDCIPATIWKNTEDDYDRVRKKMSEFLVRDHIPVNLIRGIIVKNSEAEQRVAEMLGDSLPDCKIKVDTRYEYYYRGYD